LDIQEGFLIALKRYAPNELVSIPIHKLEFDSVSETLANWNQSAIQPAGEFWKFAIRNLVATKLEGAH
jgi:hypothetical protein